MISQLKAHIYIIYGRFSHSNLQFLVDCPGLNHDHREGPLSPSPRLPGFEQSAAAFEAPGDDGEASSH